MSEDSGPQASSSFELKIFPIMSRMYQERVQSFDVIEECDQNVFNVPTDLSRNASNENFNYEITNDGHHSHCM